MVGRFRQEHCNAQRGRTFLGLLLRQGEGNTVANLIVLKFNEACILTAPSRVNFNPERRCRADRLDILCYRKGQNR